VEWWSDVWRSPMAAEYLAADRRGLYRLATLEQDFWDATTSAARLSISAEIRRAGLPFGLNPIDRRRLQWQVGQDESAPEKAKTRRAARKKPRARKDPRDVLRIA